MLRGRRRRGFRRYGKALAFVIVALGAHLVVGAVADGALPPLGHTRPPSVPISLVVLAPPEDPVPDPVEEEEEDPLGKLVDVAPPEEEVPPPEDTEYLAEHDQRVEKETLAKVTELTPDVVAPEKTVEAPVQEQREAIEPVEDAAGEGADAGEKFDPKRHGSLASLPSKFAVTNKSGSDAPMAGGTASERSGSPFAQQLDEESGDATYLNTKEFLYADYLNKIRRMVVFYWEQNVDNMPQELLLAKPRYRTVVKTVLSKTGGVVSVEIKTGSGSVQIDECVVKAFHMAAPFPPPPDGLMVGDVAPLPDMPFSVVIGRPENPYQGVDMRSGVQFPGLHKGI